MTALAWLPGLSLPACGAIGAAGVPVRPFADITRIALPATPNHGLGVTRNRVAARLTTTLPTPAKDDA